MTFETHRGRAVALTASLLGLLCVGALNAGQPQDSERIERTRAAIEKNFEARRTLSRERKEWALGRETLAARIDVVQAEIDGLRKKLDEARNNVATTDSKRSELALEKDRLQSATRALGAVLAGLETRTRELIARLPDPIRERVRPLSQSLPANPAATELSLGQRFQNVIGILNEVDKFNRDITVTTEVRTLSDGTSAEVVALYLGIAQGYYVGGNGLLAGVGTATPDGWVWTPANAAAPEIAAAIAILQDEQVASFVRLPLEIR
jgi:hypothetical protein